MLGLGDDPFKFAAFRVMFRIFFTVFCFTNLTDSLHRAGGCAAVAILGFRMAGVTHTDSGVGLFIAVLRPSTPVVVQHIAGEEGRLIRRALGAEAAGRAGLVINVLFRAGRAGFQILRFRNFRRKIVRQKLAVFAAADRADSLGGAGRRAAVAILGFRMAGVTHTDSSREQTRVWVALPLDVHAPHS